MLLVFAELLSIDECRKNPPFEIFYNRIYKDGTSHHYD